MRKTTRRMPPTIVRAAVLALCLSLVFSAAVAAQTASDPQTIVTIGDSRIYRDLTSAKNAAISESLFFAVQKAASELLSVEEITANFEPISDLLVSRRDEFIQNYKIIRELRTDQRYRVLVQTTILMDRMQEELGSIRAKATPAQLPAVVLMIAEQPVNSREYSYWWEKGQSRFLSDTAATEIMAIFEEKGIPLVRPNRAESGAESLYANLELEETPSNYEAARFASRLGADLVVVGTARVSPSSNRMGSDDLRTMQAAVDVRVLRTDNGEILTVLSEKAVAAGENPDITAKNALTDAARQAGRQLSSRLVSLWGKSEDNAGALTLSVTGGNILPHLERFRQSLQNIRGISSLQTRQMTPSSATLEVQYEGTSQDLADALLLRAYDQFGVNITGVSPGRLDVELVPEF